jgi:ribosomal protein L40E
MMLCQHCETPNLPEKEVCRHCGNKLLVLSGVTDAEQEIP